MNADGMVARLLDEPGATWMADHGPPAYRLAVELLRGAAPYRGERDGLAGQRRDEKERVAFALSATRVRGRIRLLRPVAVAGVLLGFGAVASAGLLHWPQWVTDTVRRLTPAASSDVATPVAPRAHRVTRTNRGSGGFELAAGQEAAGAGDPSSLPLDLPVVLPSADERDPAGVAGAHRELAARGRAGRRGAGAEDTSSVLAAMRALRRDHDPVRARTLLAVYLDRHPNGSLVEEALAMTIEAAVAHHDADAVPLAKNYLQLYPSGPFRGLASRTLAQPR